jgi:hypothetical protein
MVRRVSESRISSSNIVMLESRKIRNLAEKRPDMTVSHRVARIFRKTDCLANDEKVFLKTQSELSAAIAPKVEREQIRS